MSLSRVPRPPAVDARELRSPFRKLVLGVSALEVSHAFLQSGNLNETDRIATMRRPMIVPHWKGNLAQETTDFRSLPPQPGDFRRPGRYTAVATPSEIGIGSFATIERSRIPPIAIGRMFVHEVHNVDDASDNWNDRGTCGPPPIYGISSVLGGSRGDPNFLPIGRHGKDNA